MLTGRFNFRKRWFGGLALFVEEEVKPLFGNGDKLKRRWRRATLIDLAQPEMRALIDLRFQPQYMARTSFRSAVPANANGNGEDLTAGSALPPTADGNPQRVTH